MQLSILLVIPIVSLLYACSNNESSFEIGEDLIKSKSEISMVDSFSIDLSTVLIDSIPTSGTSLALVGTYKNEYTGSLKASTYFNFDLGEDISDISNETVYDSITIVLTYEGYLMGDSTEKQSVEIYQLTEQLELQSDDY